MTMTEWPTTPWTPPAQQPWPVAGNMSAPAKPVLNPAFAKYDAMTQDQILMEWQRMKDAIEAAKETEMEMRKYIVTRAFPKPEEGMNTVDLGNGYQLKAAIKYNYNLADNETVEAGLDKIAALGNQGAFIAERLVSWKPSFLLKEYRQLCEDKEKGSKFAEETLAVINTFLTVTEAAPTVEIKAPKAKK